jgi:glycosyltransferase involved in cell wall biosynthesis
MLSNLALRVPGILGSRKADVTWLERNFVFGLDDLAVLLKSPIVLDIDDAIWLYGPFGPSGIKRLVRRVDMVFAGNQFLADWCSNYCENVQVVPTAVDSTRFRPRLTPKSDDGPFVVGWTGTSSNFRFLKIVEPALARFLGTNPTSRFMVVADQRPSLPALPRHQMAFVQWSPEIEHTALQDMDVGIMPIDDSEWSRGKCSFKMLQYMATGIPVIASPYGMNSEVLALGRLGLSAVSLDEWSEALDVLHRDAHLRRNLGRAGRLALERTYALEIVAARIANHIRRLVS